MASHSPSSKLSVPDQACAWFTRLQANDLSPAEQEQFTQWLQKSPEHSRAFQRMEQLWALLAVPAQQVHQKRQAEKSLKVPGKTRSYRIPSLLSLPLLVLLVFMAPRIKNFYQDLQSDYHTAHAGQLNVKLEDQSTLTLNGNSAVKLDFSGGQRRVHLLRGEVFFQVAHNKARPFIVSSGDAETRAVGTAFSVSATDGSMRVIVSEGTVEVSSGHIAQAALVHVNQQVFYQHAQLSPVSEINSRDALAWCDGYVIFHSKSLQELVNELNRYRTEQIVIMNPRLKQRLVSGVFNTSDPNAAIEGINATLAVRSVSLLGAAVLLY